MIARKKTKYHQGTFTPKNPDKYIGDVNKIRYMSSYELEFHHFMDNNTRVIRWASESIIIPYLKPTDNRIHKYYPDYFVEYVDANGEIKQELIEVKPRDQISKPRSNHKYALYEQVTHEINKAKWAAAVKWCEQHNMVFRLVTEKGIFK